MISGTPEGTRTPDRWIRNPLLYPAELRARVVVKYLKAGRNPTDFCIEGSRRAGPLAISEAYVGRTVRLWDRVGGGGRSSGQRVSL
jgi:hypothetical protein